MKLAAYDFRDPPLLSDAEIEEILGRLDAFLSWASDVKDFAYKSALDGKVWNGWKLVEGRSNRKYTNERAAAAAVMAAGYDPYEKKLLGVTEMQKALGRKQFNEILGDLIIKPKGKPALVPESDKRPAINTATDDFKEEY